MLKQKTVYFREEDLEKWEAIENKAEFLHNALNPGENIKSNKDGTLSPKMATLPTEVYKPRGVKLCKHGNPKGECFSREAARMKCNVL